MLIAAIWLIAVQPQPPASRGPSPNLQFVTGLLESAAIETEPSSRDVWEKALRDEGLSPDSDGMWWRLRTKDGELRVTRFDFPDRVSYFFRLTVDPRREPIPDAILAVMLRDARYTHLEGDHVVIGLPARQLQQSKGYAGEAKPEITVLLSGGRLAISTMQVEWRVQGK